MEWKRKEKIHIITIENHSDNKKNGLSILYPGSNNDLKYSYRDAEGNSYFETFIENLKNKQEKILLFRMHVNCEYRKFREKQINQWVTIENVLHRLACPLKLDPYQFQSDVVQFSIEASDIQFRLDDHKIDLSLQYLMPDTTIQFTIITEQL